MLFPVSRLRFLTVRVGLLKVWLTPGFMPPGRRPFGEQARIQPGSVYPNVAVDASGDRSARPSGRSLCATSLACPNGPDRGRSSATRRRTIPSPHYHQQHRPDPSIRRARNAVEPAGTSENEIATRDPSERHTLPRLAVRHDEPQHHQSPPQPGEISSSNRWHNRRFCC
jgi:hypothetical protein